jgi:hypothetical protein
MSSMKNMRNMVINAIPSAQSYSVIGPLKHGELRALAAGASNYRISILFDEYDTTARATATRSISCTGCAL